MTDDETLIRAAQTGDAGAFEDLLERHYDILYRFAYKWCGNRDDAQDIAQQACINIARRLSSYRFESAFTSWVYRVVVNCAKDWSRSQGRHSGAEVGEDARRGEASTDANAVEQQVYLWQLLHRLDALPEGIKEILLLVHAEGLTHREAAAILDQKESTVSWRLHEFRKEYRLVFNEGGIGDG